MSKNTRRYSAELEAMMSASNASRGIPIHLLWTLLKNIERQLDRLEHKVKELDE